MPYLVDAAELELGLFLRDAVEHEATLGVVQQPEQVAGLLDLDHICFARSSTETTSAIDKNEGPGLVVKQQANHSIKPESRLHGKWECKA